MADADGVRTGVARDGVEVIRRVDLGCIVTTQRILPGEVSVLGFERITFDPNVLGGKACIRGMRISVSLIVNLVANRMTVTEIITEYPSLEEEDVAQALRYAAWASEDVFIAAAETA